MRLLTISAVLVVAGIAIFAFTFVRLVSGVSLDQQTRVPALLRTEVEEAGRYYVWDNHWTFFKGERVKYPADCPADAKIVIHDATGVELTFVPDSSQGWSIGNNEKTSVGYVDVPQTAELRIEVDGVGRERIFSVSNSTLKQELWKRLGGLVVGLVVGLLGFLMALVGIFSRRRQR